MATVTVVAVDRMTSLSPHFQIIGYLPCQYKGLASDQRLQSVRWRSSQMTIRAHLLMLAATRDRRHSVARDPE